MSTTRAGTTIVALTACAVLLAAAWQHSAAIPLAVIDMASYAPSGRILGAQTIDKLGQSLAAGDFNGDGTDDILVGADEADGPSNGRTAAGEAYIILGSVTLGTVDLANSEQNLTILGDTNNDHLGTPLATGDFNDDGFADAVVAARFADGPGDARQDAGEVYLVFGSAAIGGVIDTASAQQDVTIYGADAGDHLPASLAVGDLNDDGIDDLLLGTHDGDGPGNTRSGGGEAYVIFGSPTLSGAIDLAGGGADVTVYGEKAGALGDRLGYGVGSGDFSGDGIDDLVVTAQWAGGPDNTRFASDAYVIFGSVDLSGVVDIASAQQDFSIYGVDTQDEMGSAAGGDLNGDGVDDILVVASRGDGPLNARPTVGDAYVVFGPVPQGGAVDVALAEQDLTIYGVDSDDKLAQLVYSLSIGDFDGDGLEDILVGTEAADGPDNGRDLAGEAYVIFGRRNLGGTIDLASYQEGIVVYGANNGDKLASLAAGDLNGDGRDEILAAAPFADGVGEVRLSCGEAYVISLEDGDDDGLLDIVDPCPGDVDCDDDNFSDYVELYLGTAAVDACPDDPSDDAWPPDITKDTVVDIVDAGAFLAAFPSVQGNPNYSQRLDMAESNGVIDVTDAGTFLSHFPGFCTNP